MPTETTAWAREHGACFEVEPLTEVRRGEHLQVGFTIRLYARLPMDQRQRPERWVEAARIRSRLREMLESLTPAQGSPARLEIQPFRTAFMTPEGDLQPEVAVEARVFHGRDYFAEVTQGEEKKVYAGVRRLAEMGFKERRRRTR